MSLTFIAIIQCFVFLLGDPGRLVAIVLLILQLTSSGGTFPIELVPKFFKVLNPFMPFTYCTSALREIISGIDYSVLARDASILSIILIVFLIISISFKRHADNVKLAFEQKKMA
jgi:putative membrane protein